jgi:hypothetical protein
VSLLEQHILFNKPDKQAREDWLEEMAIPVEFDANNPMYVDLVRTGAATDGADAHDIMQTELLIARQPHREKELREALTARRAPRVRARNR